MELWKRCGLLVLVVIALGSVIPAVVSAASGQSSGAPQALAIYPSGGLGLVLEDWEAIYGTGIIGQSYLEYPLRDRTYYVALLGTNAAVAFIERRWDDPAGATLDEALAETATILPADARLTEFYPADSAFLGYGTDVYRYRSQTLLAQYAGTAAPLSPGFVVIVEKVPAPDALDARVVRVTITTGVRP
jgi:hypothetical protein